MIRINFFGDFKIKDISKLRFGDNLLALLEESDVNLLNFEAPIYVEGAEAITKSGPNLFQDRAAPEFLQKKGFNVFSLANNHALDYGKKAALETIKSFDKSITLGCGKWNEAFRVKTLMIKGVKIGFLALTQHEFGTFDDEFYDKDKIGTASLSHPIVDELIVEAKQANDFLFVIPHAGMEHCPQPFPQLVTLYRHFINMGASGVIASHPHVPQPWEIYKGCPIFYCLGNFCFDHYTVDNKEIEFLDNSLVARIMISDRFEVKIESHQLCYDYKSAIVELCDEDKTFSSYMKRISSDFHDHDKYKAIIDNYANNMVNSYIYSFSENGFFRFDVKRYVRLLLSYFYRLLPWLQRRQQDSSHLLNDFQCEIHQWTIRHLLKNNRL